MTDQDKNRPAPDFDIGKLAGNVFMGFGALAIVGGIALVFEDPGGFALIAFGVIFAAAGYFARRMFAVPAGKKAVHVGRVTGETRRLDGTRGVQTQSTLLYVDEAASDEEVLAAKVEWLHERWRERPDWVSGKIVGDAAKSISGYYWGAALYVFLALVFAVTAYFWEEEIIWLAAAGCMGFAVILLGLGYRKVLGLRKFGESRFEMDECPAVLGGRLDGQVHCGVPRTTELADGFLVRLSCVYRWEETAATSSSSGSRRTHKRRKTLWETEYRNAGKISAKTLNHVVPVALDLPDIQSPTTLGLSSDGVSWELAVTAKVKGLDFIANFEVPVLTPEDRDLLRD